MWFYCLKIYLCVVNKKNNVCFIDLKIVCWLFDLYNKVNKEKFMFIYWCVWLSFNKCILVYKGVSILFCI